MREGSEEKVRKRVAVKEYQRARLCWSCRHAFLHLCLSNGSWHWHCHSLPPAPAVERTLEVLPLCCHCHHPHQPTSQCLERRLCSPSAASDPGTHPHSQQHGLQGKRAGRHESRARAGRGREGKASSTANTETAQKQQGRYDVDAACKKVQHNRQAAKMFRPPAIQASRSTATLLCNKSINSRPATAVASFHLLHM